MILPPAVTYARKWVKPTTASALYIPNPDYLVVEYRVHFLCDADAFKQILIGPPPQLTRELLDNLTFKSNAFAESSLA